MLPDFMLAFPIYSMVSPRVRFCASRIDGWRQVHHVTWRDCLQVHPFNISAKSRRVRLPHDSSEQVSLGGRERFPSSWQFEIGPLKRARTALNSLAACIQQSPWHLPTFEDLSDFGERIGDDALIEFLVSTGTIRNASTFPLPCQSVTS